MKITAYEASWQYSVITVNCYENSQGNVLISVINDSQSASDFNVSEIRIRQRLALVMDVEDFPDKHLALSGQ